MTTNDFVFAKTIINCVGLTLDLIGVIVLFFNTQELFKIEEPDIRRQEKLPHFSEIRETNEINKIKLRNSKIGLALISFGFILQIIATALNTYTKI